MNLANTLENLSDTQLKALLHHLDLPASSINNSNKMEPSNDSDRMVLVAYYLLSNSADSHDACEILTGLEDDILRKHCYDQLPQHMCPSRFVALNHIPTLPNGKVALNQLPVPGPVERSSSDDIDEIDERSEVLDVLISLLAKLLKMEDIRPSDNFFEIGGDSITAIQFLSQTRAAGYNLDISAVIESGTIEKIAAACMQEKVPACTDTVLSSTAKSPELTEEEIDDFLQSLE